MHSIRSRLCGTPRLLLLRDVIFRSGEVKLTDTQDGGHIRTRCHFIVVGLELSSVA
jgi:hypothetical protein